MGVAKEPCQLARSGKKQILREKITDENTRRFFFLQKTNENLGLNVSSSVLLSCFALPLAYFLYRVIVADYSSTYGNEVLQTNLRSLERSGDDLLTKEMFKLF